MNEQRRELLISRVVDREESVADWDELEQDGVTREDVLEELIHAFRCDAALRGALALEVDRAKRVNVDTTQRPGPTQKRFGGFASTGWLAAAAVLLAWMLQGQRADDGATALRGGATPIAVNETATSVRELAPVIVRTRPASAGAGYDILYMRRLLESRHVEEVLGLDVTDEGTWGPVPLDDVAIGTPTVF